MATESGPGDTGLATALVEALPEPAALFDRNRRLLAVSAAAAALTGRSPAELAGCSFDEWQAAVSQATLVVAGEGGGESLQTRSLPRRRFEVQVLPAPCGELYRLVDVTERERLRDALGKEREAIRRDLQVLQARLEAAEKFQAELTQNVTHDLRTPLASIKAAASGLLADDMPSDPDIYREALTLIEEEADRLQRRVSNLLSLARMEANEGALVLDWVDISDVIGRALDGMRPLWHGRTVVTDLPEELPMVRADFDQVETALRNLIENALLYSPPGTPLEISASPGLGQVLIRVRDYGPGIMPDEAEHVFEKFYRGRAARRIPGTGLGLPICRRIAEAHGGRIWVEHVPGGGAAVVLALPLAPGEDPELVHRVE